MIKRGIFRSLARLQTRSIIIDKAQVVQEKKENELLVKIANKIKVELRLSDRRTDQ